VGILGRLGRRTPHGKPPMTRPDAAAEIRQASADFHINTERTNGQ
jgi:hypothetical protein